MHILIISDAYPPMRTSCATQIYDLAQAFLEQDNQVSIVIPAHYQGACVEISDQDGPTVYSVRCFKTKDVNYVRRTLAEFINPFVIGFHLKRNPHFLHQKIDGITWYSPSIFWGPLVKSLKARFHCKAYLILRDIFPDWAVDLGLMKKNTVYQFFKRVERYQYAQADCIGVQSPNNVGYFNFQNPQVKAKLEVLWNWASPSELSACSIDIQNTVLKGRKIIIYAGNLGVAQGADKLLEIAKAFVASEDIGFLFIGRGSEKRLLMAECERVALKNTLFLDEISSKEIPGLFAQCHAGMLSLDAKHATHNIPGKFISYMQHGLPVLAVLNKGNDLFEVIKKYSVGVALEAGDKDFKDDDKRAVHGIFSRHLSDNCRKLACNMFNPLLASNQILTYFSGAKK